MNKSGKGVVSIECSLHTRKIYFTTHVYLQPNQWDKGFVVNHPLEKKLNYYLYKEIIRIENIELDAILEGRNNTLSYLKNAVTESICPSADIGDFAKSVIEKSERKSQTKMAYRTTVKTIEVFRKGTTIGDIDYQWLIDFEFWMKARGLKWNTRIGRLRCVRTLISEAIRRDLIKTDDDPFKKFRLKGMIAKKGFLKLSDIRRLINMKLIGREAHIRDVFVFSCICGLRYSDLSTLKSENIQNGWIVKTMVKTGVEVRIPISRLWKGIGVEILNKYDSVERFARIGCNSASNRTLAKIGKDAGIKLHLTWHVGRHTAASNLLSEGVPLTTVQQILGHKKLDVTRGYAETDVTTVVKDVRRAFK